MKKKLKEEKLYETHILHLWIFLIIIESTRISQRHIRYTDERIIGILITPSKNLDRHNTCNCKHKHIKHYHVT